jgi:outer membrane immunogenic protein
MTKRLTAISIATGFVLAASGFAFAADTAVKAPPSPPPAPVYNWTGWYVGGNLGASFGSVKTDFNVSPVTSAGTTNSVTPPGLGFSDQVYPSGFIGGGQIGYNWQYSPLIVVGLEADFQGADEKDSATLNNSFSATVPVISITTGLPVGAPIPVTGAAVTNYTTQIDWFGTVRARIGYLWGDGQVFSYVTGGLAYGEVKINGTNIFSGLVPGTGPLFSVAQAFDHSHVNTGWTVGSGTEGKLLIPGWTYKIEALYVDLGTLDTTGVTSGFFGGFGAVSVTGGQVTTHTHFTDTILRAGLNYQFH